GCRPEPAGRAHAPTRPVRCPVMAETVLPWITGLAAVVGGAGLWLLVRGVGGSRTAARIGDTGTSTIASLAAGEVRVSGVIEAAEVTLVSPLQSRPCVYYRSSVSGEDDDRDPLSGFHEERAVGFRVRDASGDLRVFPREARWDAPVAFDERTDTLGDEPSGLDLRDGSAFAPAEVDRAAAIAALLTVQQPRDDGDARLRVAGRGQRHYQEA